MVPFGVPNLRLLVARVVRPPAMAPSVSAQRSLEGREVRSGAAGTPLRACRANRTRSTHSTPFNFEQECFKNQLH